MNGNRSRNEILVEIGKLAGITFINQQNGWFLDGNPVWETKAIDDNGTTAWITDSLDRVHSCFNGITKHESEEKTAKFLMKAGATIELAVQPDWTLKELWRSTGFSSIHELQMKATLQGGNQT